MKERSILFSAPMVRALLAGTKTQTRRIIKRPLNHPGRTVYTYYGPGKNNPAHASVAIANGPDSPDGSDEKVRCPYGAAGDRLWVRETWAPRDQQALKQRDRAMLYYRADGEREHETDGKWRPSIFMPRWASRITLEVTGVRVEQLQEITESDAKAEGVDPVVAKLPTHRDAYRSLWGEINGAGSWDENPWVWVIEFKRLSS
jgi:hypothetical protein